MRVRSLRMMDSQIIMRRNFTLSLTSSMDRISGPHSLSTMTTLETTSFPSCEVVPFPAAFLAIISHRRFVSSLSSHCLANSLANDGST